MGYKSQVDVDDDFLKESIEQQERWKAKRMKHQELNEDDDVDEWGSDWDEED